MIYRILFLQWLLTWAVAAQTPDFSPLQKEMEAMVSSRAAVSASVAVVHNGKIVFLQAVGMADKDRKVVATVRTRYRIGSITKLVTALAVMQLVEKGQLKLDDPLIAFEPDFPGAANITVRQLLQHRSGIGNYLDLALSDGRVKQATTPLAIVQSMARQPLESAPGSQYSYSNTNYVLLGLIVEKISQLPLAEYYQRNLFQPAGMTETKVGEIDTPGYRGGQPQDPGHVSWYYACGDLTSTAEDLARLDIALMEGRIVSPATLNAMQSDAFPAGSGPSRYGLGMQLNRLGDRLLAGHHGGLPGFESDDEMCLDDRFAVIALGNDYDFSTSRLLGVALSVVYPEQVKAAQAEAAARAAQRLEREQPELTARFTALMRQLLTSDTQPENLTEAMRSALTPAVMVGLRRSLSALGEFQKLEFIDDDEVSGLHSYRYRAHFQNGPKPFTFVLDGRGRLAGLVNQ